MCYLTVACLGSDLAVLGAKQGLRLSLVGNGAGPGTVLGSGLSLALDLFGLGTELGS